MENINSKYPHLAVLVQSLVVADVAAVAFSANPITTLSL